MADYFLKIDGIEGESQDSKHKNEIDVESWSWGETNTGGTAFAGGGSGKVQMQDFHFVMKTSKASPKLLLACASGQHIKDGLLSVRKAGRDQQEYLKFTLTDVLVSSYQIAGAGGAESDAPTDQLSLAFAKIEIEYRQQNPDGSLGDATTGGWDLKRNTPTQ